ncbi:MAG: WecB/TagA/CpsF family glycosyltransferase [Micromonosporaceae bacterium]
MHSEQNTGGTGIARVAVGGIDFDPLTEREVIEYIVAALDRGQGGTIVTPNVDIARQARRSEEAARLVANASLVLADGMPLVWASRLAAGTRPRWRDLGALWSRQRPRTSKIYPRRPRTARIGERALPGRVAGSDLIWSLSAAVAAAGRTVYLLGGAPGAPSVPERAADVLRSQYPGLAVAGAESPPYGFDGTAGGTASVVAAVKAAKPDLVFVGLGFPRQESLIETLAAELPAAWFVGCGASIAFAAGAVPRAPGWMRRLGLEWLHRLSVEPRRLFRRYVLYDLPYAVRLLLSSLLRR